MTVSPTPSIWWREPPSHDGKPITSEDVAFSFEMVKKNHSFGPSMLGPVDRVETPDPQTAVFKLIKPHPAMFMVLSPPLLPILPKHVYNEKDHGPIRKNPANVKPIGSGPFKLAEFKPGDYFILERYDGFFRPWPTLPGSRHRPENQGPECQLYRP